MSTQLDEILIVEDEPLIAEDIAETLKEAGYGVSGIAHNANDAIKILRNSSPSLVMLDIRIDGEIDGLMLAGIIKDQFDLPFMFLTSYTDPATLDKVKQLQPYGFIVKPFDDRELTSNIEIAIHRFKKESTNLASVEGGDPDSLFVKVSNNYHRIKIKDILYAQAWDNYCYVYVQNQKFLLPHTLKTISEKLPPDHFFRVHKSYLVNISCIDSIMESEVMVNKIAIPISKGSKSNLLSRISFL
ncbi:MAG TPA: DNA-binding response regulator [Cryomorphaceae bacterium]|nr:DNA-binding response regulator [Owenweeksia sp.]HAD97704.1 DNA-binding response regulator [Cryomorphaceae bacterium]HBF21072.1 DNA-binding response regulator [Cryomorphaceae bacterium]|tara:strand:- start:2837 stop:3565 length:729 start_codon:yes stop_codon:yes gene_type:complete